MIRKRNTRGHSSHERWLVSYADFITLLFAFFVVMYAVSSVNEGKYRVLSDSMVAAFRSPTKSIMPIQIGNIVKSPSGAAVELPPLSEVNVSVAVFVSIAPGAAESWTVPT